MFERFTDRARRAVVLAQEDNRLRNGQNITTDDLLRGLVLEGESVAAHALTNVGVVVHPAQPGTGAGPSGHIPFTAQTKKVLELSVREALQLGHNYIAPEHILLALCREMACPSPDLVRKEVIRLLSSHQAVETAAAKAKRLAGTSLTPTAAGNEGRFTLAIVGPDLHIVDTHERVTTSIARLTPTDDAADDQRRGWALCAVLNEGDLGTYDAREPF